MKLKRHINFINELYEEDLKAYVTTAEEHLLEIGAEKVNGRWNFNGSISLKSVAVYRGNLLVPFGTINGDFTCNNEDLKNSSIKNLPKVVKGNLNLSGNHFSDLEDFDVEVTGGIDLSHNHLHELKNMPKKLNGSFDVSSNMITSLEGCPKEVESFNCIDNWLKTLHGAPKRVLKWNNGSSKQETGAEVILDKKIPSIESEFYRNRSYVDKEDTGSGHYGITNYWTELYQFIMEKFQTDWKYRDDKELGDKERDKAITSIYWPDDIKGNLLKKSITTVSKFSL